MHATTGRVRNGAGTDPDLGFAFALRHQIVHLIHASLKTDRLDRDARPGHAVFVTIDLTDRLERFENGDILEVNRDRLPHVRMHHHAVWGAFDEGEKNLIGRCLAHLQIKSGFDGPTIDPRHLNRNGRQ